MNQELTASTRRIKEKRLIKPVHRRIGIVLYVVGALLMAVGLFGMLAGDWQLSAFSTLADQVYAAREAAQSAGTGITAAFDLNGEDSGVHIYYAELSGTDNDVLNVQDFEAGQSKKALKASTLQFPATKDHQTLVVEEEPVQLSNGETVTRGVRIPGAGTGKYNSLKMTVEGACELKVWAKSSMPSEERKLILYSTTSGDTFGEASAPAFSTEGPLHEMTFRIEKAGTYYLSVHGSIPIAPVSDIMNYGAILFLIGLTLVFNGIMMQLQPWERMKDLFFVEPVLVFFLLFVYYPVIDLFRISFTNMGILTTGKQEFIGLGNYNWLFNQSGARYFWESLKITGIYMFWEVTITLVGGMLLALLFNRMTRSFNAMRAAVFMPKYIAVSTSATVFTWILHSTMATGIGSSEGILNYVLSLFGITGPHWLIDANTALTGVLILTAWRVVGYAMMIYLSAMKGISNDYYEAAAIDGADGVQRFRYITLPLLAPTTLFLFVTTFIASMKVFQSVDVMTGGGPGTSTNVMVQWIYNLTFKDFQTGHGAAVSLVFFVILLVCTALTMKYSNRNVNYDA